MVRHTGEDFIDEEGITVASVLSLQSTRVYCAELNAPEVDRFSAGGDATFGEEIFDIPMAEAEVEVEAIIEPDCIGNDVWRKTVTFVCIHLPILAVWANLLVSTGDREIWDSHLI